MLREIELKLTADPDVLARVRRAKEVRALATGPARTSDLESVYFDSPELALGSRAIALRVRRIGRRFVQTVKANGDGGALASRQEWEADLPLPVPNPAFIGQPDIARRVAKLMDRGALLPSYRTQIRRSTRLLKTPEGDLIEIAFDQGQITAPDAQTGQPIGEIELELKSGDPLSLLALARRLAAAYPLRLQIKSKSERGLDLLANAPHRPQRAGPLVLAPGLTVGEAFGAAFSHCLRHALANEDAVLRARDPEGVHQLRVALRRFRSAIAAFGRAVRAPEIQRLHREAKWIAGVAGAARDLDVFVEATLEPLAAAAPDDGALAAFLSLARAERDQAWRSLVDALEGARGRLLMIDLAFAVTAEAWRAAPDDMGRREVLEGPVTAFAAEVLSRRWAATAELGARLETLDLEHRHALRIELKKLRYAGEFFASLFPEKRVKAYLKRLSALQDVFGHLNDAAVAQGIGQELLRKSVAADPASSGAMHWAAGLVTGWHAARMDRHWPEAAQLWRALAKAEPYWSA